MDLNKTIGNEVFNELEEVERVLIKKLKVSVDLSTNSVIATIPIIKVENELLASRLEIE